MEPDWARVFPEIGDPQTRASLLTRIDAVGGLASSCPDLDVRDGAPVAGYDDIPFGGVVAGLLSDLLHRFEDETRGVAVLNDHDAITASVLHDVVGQAALVATRSLVRLLHRCRDGGLLTASTPEERFGQYVAMLGSGAVRRSYLSEYADVIRHLRVTTARRLDAVRDLLLDTEAEWAQVATRVRGVDVGDRVASIDLGGGDVHAGGRSVCTLRLTSGAAVVVKPRDVRLEQGYWRFVGWLADQVGAPASAPAVHASSCHAWVEHVSPAAEAHPEYFTALGVQLAALFLLNGTDIHYENLLTDQRGLPVVVDLEALFSPHVEGTDRPRDGLLGVESTGLLSMPRTEERHRDFDFGALGYRPGARSPFATLHAVDVGRDDMHLRMERLTVEHVSPVPTGLRWDAQSAGQLVGGFERAVGWVLAHRPETLGRLDTDFDEGAVRYIHRGTTVYGQVMRMATHPDFSRERDRCRALGRVAVLAPVTPWGLAASEIGQMAGGDLPLFHVPLRGTVVTDGLGRDTGCRATRAPFERVRAGIEKLTVADLREQVSRVRSSVGGGD